MASSSLEHRNHEANNDSESEDINSASRIQKAAKFWKHPSMTSVPASEKMEYLKAKGYSTEEIHQMWDHLVSETTDETETTEAANINIATKEPPARWTQPTTAPPQPHQQYDEESSSQQSLALLTVGGMIGVTAAAATRWLNGGDFTLFPPPTVMGKGTAASTQMKQSNCSNFASQMKGEYPAISNEELLPSEEEEEGEKIPSEHTTFELSQQVQEIKSLVQEQVRSQEKILTYLTMQQTKKVTDQSMELLRECDVEHISADDDGSFLVMEEVKSLLEQQLVEDPSLSSSGGCSYVQQALQKIENHQQERVTDSSSSNINHSQLHDDSLIGAPNTSRVANTNEEDTGHDELMDDVSINDTHTSLKLSIQRLATENNSNESELQSGCQVLYLYVVHLSSNPHVPRYRKIYTSNDSFRQVELLHGGMDLLLAVGFVKNEGYLEWAPQDEDVAMQCLQEASAALTILKSNNTDSIKEFGTSVMNTANDEGNSSDTSFQTPQGTNLLSPPNTKKQVYLPTPEIFPDTPQQQQSLPNLDEASQDEDNLNNLSSEGVGVSPKRFFFESSPQTAGGAF